MRKKTKQMLLRWSVFGCLLVLVFCGAFLYAGGQEALQPGAMDKVQANLELLRGKDKNEPPAERPPQDKNNTGTNDSSPSDLDRLRDKLPSTAEAQAQARRLKDKADAVVDGALPRLKRLIFLRAAVNDATKDEITCPFERISPQLTSAIVAVEDSHFYEHHGFDLRAIARATLVNLQYGQVEEGASTITQQLVKNIFLSPEQTLARKLDELALALDLELHYTKEEILTLYLNSIYFGSGFYGIEDAARGYFGKTPDKLTLAEAAMLAGLPNAPSLYSPYEDFMLAKKRQFIVLDAMVRTGAITEQQAMSAKIEPLYLAR